MTAANNEPSPHRVPVAKPLGKIAPWKASLGDPQHGVHEQTIVGSRHARVALLAGQRILDPFPMFIRNGVATKHRGPSLAREKTDPQSTYVAPALSTRRRTVMQIIVVGMLHKPKGLGPWGITTRRGCPTATRGASCLCSPLAPRVDRPGSGEHYHPPRLSNGNSRSELPT